MHKRATCDFTDDLPVMRRYPKRRNFNSHFNETNKSDSDSDDENKNNK